jgi:hypothetical protein
MKLVKYHLLAHLPVVELKSKALMSSITFGFELEALANYNLEFADIVENLNSCFDRLSFELGMDSSIKPMRVYTKTFEAQFGVFPFTPIYLNKTLKGLQDLNSHGFQTNKSCGFHIHIKFPFMTKEASAWILLATLDDKEFQKKLLTFEKYKFFNTNHANKSQFSALMFKALKNKDYTTLQCLMTSAKEVVLRLHPQGTVEWRGPRNFLNEGNPDTIKKFILLLYDIVSFWNKALDLDTLPNTGFTKEDFKNLILKRVRFPNKVSATAGILVEKSDPKAVAYFLKHNFDKTFKERDGLVITFTDNKLTITSKAEEPFKLICATDDLWDVKIIIPGASNTPVFVDLSDTINWTNVDIIGSSLRDLSIYKAVDSSFIFENATNIELNRYSKITRCSFKKVIFQNINPLNPIKVEFNDCHFLGSAVIPPSQNITPIVNGKEIPNTKL